MDAAAPGAARRDYVVWLVVAATAAALTAAFAARYGALNQATYLLDPLRRAMPELFRRDWLVGELPPDLPAFGWLTQWLYAVDPEGPVAVLAASFVVTLGTYVAMHRLVTAVCPGARGFVIVASFVTVTMGRAMGGSYLLAGYLQPSSLATLGWIWAMAELARARYLACGIVLAVAGALHVNFLVLGIGLFTLGALARRDARPVELVQLLAPQLVVLAFYLPDLLGAARPSDEAVQILVRFHAPGHYDGRRLMSWIPPLVGWQLAALAALPLIGGAARAVRALWRFSLMSFAVAVATAVIVRIPALLSLTQVRWSRIAPFGQLACQVLVVAALIHQAGAPARSIARRAWLAAAIALALVLNARALHTPWPATVIAIAGAAAVLALPSRLARHAATGLAVIALGVALWASPRGAGLTTEPVGSTGELALARWVRASTPTDALFVAPPDLMRFRLHARRAVIADTKSPPLRPDYLVQWYRRLCAMVDRPDVATHEDVEQLYHQLAPEQLERIARTFGADYIVVAAAMRMPGTPVYANPDFAVYRVAR
ncbi:MAG TPA: DUF6798 domain-containing protein [Kofleriaceae bacterium]